MSHQTIDRFVDRKLLADGGTEIGKVRDVILRPSNLKPEWLVVKTGWLRGEHLVPVISVSEHEEDLVVPYTKDWIDASPRAEERIAPRHADAEAAYRHYGLTVPTDDAI